MFGDLVLASEVRAGVHKGGGGEGRADAGGRRGRGGGGAREGNKGGGVASGRRTGEETGAQVSEVRCLQPSCDTETKDSRKKAGRA